MSPAPAEDGAVRVKTVLSRSSPAGSPPTLLRPEPGEGRALGHQLGGRENARCCLASEEAASSAAVATRAATAVLPGERPRGHRSRASPGA